MNAHAKITPTTATIDQLKPGSERPGGAVNSRKEYAKADIEGRLASIVAHGLLRPLLVVFGPASDKPPFYVADGGLSREAIALGVKSKKLDADYQVNISVANLDAAGALAASIEANDQVVPPHPVKVFEAFSQLQILGKTVEEIAKLFRLEPKDVRGYLALGALSPKIRKAWIDEEIDEDAAKAFTIASDQKQQDAAFDKLKRRGRFHLDNTASIRAELVGDQDDAASMLAFVGKDAYEAVGGKMIEDLFGGDHAVSDQALLKKMGDEKIKAKCDDLVADGWKWAEPVTNENRHAEHSWQTVTGGKGASAKNKALAGCRVDVENDGRFQILYGLIRPGDVKKTAKAAESAKTAPAKPKGPVKISNSLGDRLGQALMHATQDALKGAADGSDLVHTLAGLIGAQLQPHRNAGWAPHPISNSALDIIRQRLPAKLLNPALAKRFDYKNYFSSAPKEIVCKAVEEMGYPAEAKKLLAGKKSAAWKEAIKLFPKTGWLPPKLRTIHYSGPGAPKKKAR